LLENPIENTLKDKADFEAIAFWMIVFMFLAWFNRQ
jgi:hypothetical protein